MMLPFPKSDRVSLKWNRCGWWQQETSRLSQERPGEGQRRTPKPERKSLWLCVGWNQFRFVCRIHTNSLENARTWQYHLIQMIQRSRGRSQIKAHWFMQLIHVTSKTTITKVAIRWAENYSSSVECLNFENIGRVIMRFYPDHTL